jgi:hypothetical protein
VPRNTNGHHGRIHTNHPTGTPELDTGEPHTAKGTQFPPVGRGSNSVRLPPGVRLRSPAPRHGRRDARDRSTLRPRRIRADHMAALRRRATWIELLVSLVVLGVVILSAQPIGLGPAVWVVLPVAFGGALAILTQRVARSRDLDERPTY